MAVHETCINAGIRLMHILNAVFYQSEKFCHEQDLQYLRKQINWHTNMWEVSLIGKLLAGWCDTGSHVGELLDRYSWGDHQSPLYMP